MNEKLKHTPGRLVFSEDGLPELKNQSQILQTESGDLVLYFKFHNREDARRLAACWNALDGVPTEHLESLIGAVMAKGGFVGLWSNYCDLKDQRSDLLETLNMATDALAGGLWDYGPGQDEHEKCNEVIAQCRAVLAKALKS